MTQVNEVSHFLKPLCIIFSMIVAYCDLFILWTINNSLIRVFGCIGLAIYTVILMTYVLGVDRIKAWIKFYIENNRSK